MALALAGIADGGGHSNTLGSSAPARNMPMDSLPDPAAKLESERKEGEDNDAG